MLEIIRQGLAMRAVICGYYGKGNGGDEALLVSLLQMLPSQVEPIVLSADPLQTSRRYGVESCPNRAAFPILKALRSADLFIWGGGSLMQDGSSLASPLYYGGLMALAQVIGLKTVAWGQGIGPLNHPLTRWLTRRVLRGCTAISVRDRISAQQLNQWGLSPILAPDPVWAMESEPVPGLRDVPVPRVAINLRSHSTLTASRLEILLEALIDFQTATQAFFLLVPFQKSQDLAIAQQIAARLPGPHQIMQIEDPRRLKGLFRGVKMTIGMRLHSLIMAAAEESNCFALSYDPKVTRLMEELEMPGLALTTLPKDAKAITTAWLQTYTEGHSLNLSQIQSLKERTLIHADVLRQIAH